MYRSATTPSGQSTVGAKYTFGDVSVVERLNRPTRSLLDNDVVWRGASIGSAR